MTAEDAALAWRLEAAFNVAWPTLRTVRAGDWVCNLGSGVSRRRNSANPLGPHAKLTPLVIDALEAAYRDAGQPSYVRLPSVLSPEPDRALAERGYGREGGPLTLIAPRALASGDAELMSGPSGEWLAAMNLINGREGAEAAVFGSVLTPLQAPAAFAAVRREGRVVAGAYAAAHDGWLCIEAVATDAVWRGQGLAGQAVGALMDWGADRGCEGAALQVSEDNAPARALYRRLGFDRELYRYHYRRGPA